MMILNGRDVRIDTSLLVGDMDIMVRFYRDILGFPTQWDGENYVPPKGINQTFEIAFWLPSFADVDAEYERLSKLNVQFPTGEPITYPFGIRNFYVADPEGNLLEIGSTREL